MRETVYVYVCLCSMFVNFVETWNWNGGLFYGAAFISFYVSIEHIDIEISTIPG